MRNRATPISQPHGPADIDPYYLAKSPVLIASAATRFTNEVNGVPAGFGVGTGAQTTTFAGTPVGIAAAGSAAATTSSVLFEDYPFGGTTPITVMAFFDSLPGANRSYVAQATEVILRTSAAGTGVEFILNSFATNDRVTVTPDTRSSPGFFAAGTYGPSGKLRSYGNTAVAEVTPTGTYANNADVFSAIYTAGLNVLLDRRLALLAIFRSEFSREELADLCRNPWRLYKPRDRRIYVDFGAGGGGEATGSLAATEVGSDTASFSAASTASGSLSATETGSDTAAIAVQVTATGNLAATEVGSDTAAISGGNPAAIGSMAAQEVGSDTASIAGIAPATGTLTAQETGADTASMAGASVVTGSLAATEVGSDSFFATSGAQQSVGTLAAQEVGSDTASASGAVVAQGALTATESGGDSAIMTGEARLMGLFAATESGQDVFSGTSIQLPARTGSMAATETGADGAAITGQSLVMGLFTAQEVGSDVFFASENDLTRIRPIQATYNTLAIDAGYNTIEIDPTYWID